MLVNNPVHVAMCITLSLMANYLKHIVKEKIEL
jgi:hypothetical protein